jgi:hypothetical protein
MIDPEYRIKHTELVRIIDAFVNFDSKALHEIVNEVLKREVKP